MQHSGKTWCTLQIVVNNICIVDFKNIKFDLHPHPPTLPTCCVLPYTAYLQLSEFINNLFFYKVMIKFVIFILTGTTRDNFEGKKVLRLEYEAYAPMAEKKMQEICDQIHEMWNVEKVAIVHRIG